MSDEYMKGTTDDDRAEYIKDEEALLDSPEWLAEAIAALKERRFTRKRNAELNGSRAFLRDTIMLKDKRIAELEAEAKHYNEVAIKTGARIAKLEAALTMISKAEAHKHDWVTVGKLIDQYALIARKALEEGND